MSGRFFASVFRTESDRQGFWYSALIGVFIGLLFGGAIAGILSSWRHHATNIQNKAGTSNATGSSIIKFHRGPLAPFIQGFVNQNGKPVTTKDLLGKVRIVTFLSPLGDHYTPLVVANLMNLYQDLKNDGLLGKKVVFVSYNVDPRHTGPRQMSEFMKKLTGITPANAQWYFLTSQPKAVRKLVTSGYGVQYRQVTAAQYAKLSAKKRQEDGYLYATAVNPLTSQYKPSYHVIHHDQIMIVGPRDHIWGHIPDASSYSDHKLMRFIATLLKLPGMSEGQGRSSAAH